MKNIKKTENKSTQTYFKYIDTWKVCRSDTSTKGYKTYASLCGKRVTFVCVCEGNKAQETKYITKAIKKSEEKKFFDIIPKQWQIDELFKKARKGAGGTRKQKKTNKPQNK